MFTYKKLLTSNYIPLETIKLFFDLIFYIMNSYEIYSQGSI